MISSGLWSQYISWTKTSISNQHCRGSGYHPSPRLSCRSIPISSSFKSSPLLCVTTRPTSFATNCRLFLISSSGGRGIYPYKGNFLSSFTSFPYPNSVRTTVQYPPDAFFCGHQPTLTVIITCSPLRYDRYTTPVPSYFSPTNFPFGNIPVFLSSLLG